MADEGFQVVFRGELAGDRPADEVKQRLAALFKMPANKVEALFSGKPVVVKRNLDEATARKFEAAFRKAGAVCELRGPAGEAGSAEAPRQPAPAPESPAAPAGASEAAASRQPAAATGTTGAGKARPSMAAAGDPNHTLLDLEVPENLEGLEVDESDAPLSPGEKKPAPDIDTSELDLAEAGGNLSEPRRQPPADIDTSGLSIDESEG